ncbi:MAG: TolC family protein, partial [Saprospiraceae bacterium]
LKFQMNYPLNQEIVLKEQFDPIYYDVTSREGELLDKYNVESRKEYKMLTTLEELQTLNIKRYKYSYYPTVVGFASHSQNLQRNQLFNSDEPGFFRTTAVGLNVTASIFDGYDRKMKIQRASIAKENVQLNKSIFLTATTLEAANANIQYQNTKQTIEARKKSLDMAEKIFATTKIKFREGVGSSLELTTAERDVYAAQAAYINALYDLIVARVDWEKAMGRL